MADATPSGGVKRPFYQRRWVWVIAGVLVVLFIIGVTTGSKNKNAKATAPSATTTIATTSMTSTTQTVTAKTSTTATTRAPTTTTTAPRATTVPTTIAPTTTIASYPVVTSPSGNEYHAGEFCPEADLNMTVEGSNGPIACDYTGGYYRWVNA